MERTNTVHGAHETEGGDDAFPRPAMHYLDSRASDQHGRLRKHYPANSDEPHFDLTPAIERAIDWLSSLEQTAICRNGNRA
jgi:Protein of unknown function (DUF3375)